MVMGKRLSFTVTSSRVTSVFTFVQKGAKHGNTSNVEPELGRPMHNSSAQRTNKSESRAAFYSSFSVNRQNGHYFQMSAILL
jgi:hypothetical protein